MKNILVLTSRIPAPLTGGDKLRIYNLCVGLAKEFRLTLLTFCSSEEEMTSDFPELDIFESVHRVHLPKWKSYLNTALALPTRTPLQLAYYRSAEFRRKAEALSAEADGVLAHLLRTSQYVDRLAIRPKILEMTDAISLTYQRMVEHDVGLSLKSLVYRIERKRLKRYESDAVRAFDLVSLISPIDVAHLQAASGSNAGNIQVFSNGVDFANLPFLGAGQGDEIVFIGNMHTLPNLDACRYFAEDILPVLRKTHSFRFKIVGDGPPSVKSELERFEGVEVTGRVAKVADAVRGAFAAVCPMRFGAGLQNKVLEYMALGLPTVTTTMGLEGIDAQVGADVLVADTPQAFAAQLSSVRTDAALATRLSQNGRAFVETHHDWEPIRAGFCSAVRAAFEAE